MKSRVLAVLLPVFLTLAGCQSVPIASSRAGFAPLPTDGHGRVQVSVFHIPKDEPGVKLFLVLGALGGAQTQVPFGASLYDVSDGLRYLGSLDSRGAYYGAPGGWLEYDAPAGRRTLMLASGNGAFPRGGMHTDFIEIDVVPGQVRHLALSQYGYMRRPYLGEIRMEERHRAHCAGMAADHPKQARASIAEYMAAQGINPHARDFANYCLDLALRVQVSVPNAEALKQFEAARADLEAARAQGYPAWLKQAEKPAPYDLMRSYEPPPKPESDSLI